MWVFCCVYKYCYSIINSYNASSYITEDQTHTHTEAHQRKTRMKLLVFLIKFINPIMSLPFHCLSYQC
jgi:uncharacterized membrane protein